MNWFEGGRRVTKLVQALLLLGCAAFAVFVRPSVMITFETTGPGSTWVLSTTPCNFSVDAVEFPSTIVGVGESSLELCFRAARFKDGRMLIPYELGPNSTWFGGEQYADDVQAYITERVRTFSLSPAIKAKARDQASKEWWSDWRENIRNCILTAVIGVLLLQALSWVIGWIVRGFAGVPSGQDHRAPTDGSE